MTEQQNEWDFYYRRLAGEVIPINVNEPNSGFYRTKLRRGRDTQEWNWATVAYWIDNDGVCRCHLNGVDVDNDRAIQLWPYASKSPITHETYTAVRNGGPWPDASPAVTQDRANVGNMPDDNSFDAIKDRIDDLAREAKTVLDAGAAKTQDEADRASDLANRLSELWNKADGARKDEKRPHDEAGKAVQVKWVPLLEAAEVFKRLKQAVVTPYLVDQEARRRAAALAAAREGEAPPAQRPVKAGATSRRSVALRTVREITISDRAAVLAFFAEGQPMTDFLQTMAEKAVRAGASVPGVEVKERQVAA